MVGGEDGKTRGHTAHWERRRAGVERKGGLGGRWGEQKSGEGVSRRKGGEEEEGGGRGSEGESEREREEEQGRKQGRD